MRRRDQTPLAPKPRLKMARHFAKNNSCVFLATSTFSCFSGGGSGSVTVAPKGCQMGAKQKKRCLDLMFLMASVGFPWRIRTTCDTPRSSPPPPPEPPPISRAKHEGGGWHSSPFGCEGVRAPDHPLGIVSGLWDWDVQVDVPREVGRRSSALRAQNGE